MTIKAVSIFVRIFKRLKILSSITRSFQPNTYFRFGAIRTHPILSSTGETDSTISTVILISILLLENLQVEIRHYCQQMDEKFGSQLLEYNDTFGFNKHIKLKRSPSSSWCCLQNSNHKWKSLLPDFFSVFQIPCCILDIEF